MKNVFLEKFVEEHFDEYYEKYEKEIRGELKEIFASVKIDMNHLYSQDEIDSILKIPAIDKLNGLWGSLYFRNDKERTGEQILDVFLAMKMRVKMSWFKTIGPEDIVVCPICGKEEVVTKYTENDRHEPCRQCRIKQKKHMPARIFDMLYMGAAEDKAYLEKLLIEESKAGIDYSDWVEGDNKLRKIIEANLVTN